MGVDIRLIKLLRKSVQADSDFVEADCELGEKTQKFLATDYFDILAVEEPREGANLAEVMGLRADQPMYAKSDTAVQSFSIYAGEGLLTLQKKQEERCFGQPFGSGRMEVEGRDISLSYLSIIQIYINPDVLAIYADERKGFFGEGILQIFADNLVDIIKGYYAENTKEVFVCRIYYLLSNGDFALVIRSERPDTSFRLSTWLRRQLALGHAVYRTYTLLTLSSENREENLVVDREKEEDSLEDWRGQNHFVIRCSYSDIYWESEQKILKLAKEKFCWEAMKRRIYSLNGRYDFTVHLFQDEFLRLLPSIVKYRRGETVSLTAGDEPKFGIVEYLIYLMSQKALSCINERFLLGYEEVPLAKEYSINSKIGSNAQECDTYHRNNFVCQEILAKYKIVCKQLKQVQRYRKNLNYYVKTMENLILFCNTLNQQPDTRIHVSVLLEQLDVVAESLKQYLELFWKTRNKNLVDAIEAYMKDAVCGLDSYAGYVRNHNLQTLQAPNYHIESNMSMEKVLIGLNEFLRSFMAHYFKIMDGTQGEHIKEILPVMIPDMQKLDFSLEILFQEGLQAEWEVEKEVRKGKNRYLMIAYCPTFETLCDIKTMMALLFHEMAHQFRYESQEQRNKVLLDEVSRVGARYIAEKILLNLGQEIEIKKFPWLLLLLSEALRKTITPLLWEEGESLQMPLAAFEGKLQRNVYRYFTFPFRAVTLNEVVQTYLQNIRSLCDFTKEEVKKQISILFEQVQEAEGVQKKDKKTRTREETVWKAGVKLACLCVGIQEGELNEEQILDIKKVEAFWKADSDRSCVEERENLWKSLRTLYVQIMDYDQTRECEWKDARERYDKFCNTFYEECASIWAGRGKQLEEEQFIPCRYLGIDLLHKENAKNFCKIMDGILQNLWVGELWAKMDESISVYREVASDLFMYVGITLEPYGYLNLLASNLVYNGYPRSLDIRRVYCVLRAADDRDMDALCKDTLKKVHESLQKILPYLGGKAPRLSETASLKRLQGFCKNYYNQILEKEELTEGDDQILKVLTHYDNVAQILDGLCKQREESEEDQDIRGFVIKKSGIWEDLKAGKKTWEKQLKERYAEEAWVRESRDFCREIGRRFNTPEEEIRKKGKGFLEREIEWILKMYYKSKLFYGGGK